MTKSGHLDYRNDSFQIAVHITVKLFTILTDLYCYNIELYELVNFGYIENSNMTSPYYYVVFFRYWAAVDLFLTTNLPILFFLASLQPTHFFCIAVHI